MDGFGDKILQWGMREEERAWRKEERDWWREQQRWRLRDMKWREEDRMWRRNDRRYRILENLRRKVDEWVELINDVSNICALVGGFAMAVIVEAPLDNFHLNCLNNDFEPDCITAQMRGDILPTWLLSVFGASAASTVGLMLWCVQCCTIISVYSPRGSGRGGLYLHYGLIAL